MSFRRVWDASPLIHAHKIERLDVLGELAAGPADARWHNFTTAAVVEELAGYGGSVPDWLEVVHVDAIGDLIVLSEWVGRVSSATHSQGEATVLAWAERHGAVAIIDDAEARRVGQAHGLRVHGSLWVLARAVTDGRWSISSASSFADQLKSSGARYPFEIGGFEGWARKAKLI